jgi:hypothetical protein
MPGFLARDLFKCREFAAKWYGEDLARETAKVTAKPVSKLIWATEFWDIMDGEQQALAEGFVRDMEGFLGVQQNKLSFKEEWAKSPPEEADGQKMDQFMKMVNRSKEENCC